MEMQSQRQSQLDKGIKRGSIRDDRAFSPQQIQSQRRNSQKTSSQSLVTNQITQILKSKILDDNQYSQNTTYMPTAQQPQTYRKNSTVIESESFTADNSRRLLSNQSAVKKKTQNDQVKSSFQSQDQLSALQTIDQQIYEKIQLQRRVAGENGAQTSRSRERSIKMQSQITQQEGDQTRRMHYENYRERMEIEPGNIISEELARSKEQNFQSQSKKSVKRNRNTETQQNEDQRITLEVNQQTQISHQRDNSIFSNKTKFQNAKNQGNNQSQGRVDLQKSIRSSKSQNVIYGARQFKGQSSEFQSDQSSNQRVEKSPDFTQIRNIKESIYSRQQMTYSKREITEQDDKHYQTTQIDKISMLSPKVRQSTINVKQAQSELKQSHNLKSKLRFQQDPAQLDEDFNQESGSKAHERRVSNFNVKKIPNMTELTSPVGYKGHKPLTARPEGLITGNLPMQKNYPRRESFDHSIDNQIRKSLGKRIDSCDSVNLSNKRILANNFNRQLTTEGQGIQRVGYVPRTMMGPQVGRVTRFGNMFKLQKKNINDEGILNMDEGRDNSSYDINIRHLSQDEPQFDSEDDYDNQNQEILSHNMQDDQKSQKRLTRFDSTLKENRLQTSDQLKKLRERSQRNLNTMQDPLHYSGREKRSRRQSRKQSKKNRGKQNNREDSSIQSDDESRIRRKGLLSYDDNSFERDLIEKLNDESSIREELLDRKKFNKSDKRGKTVAPKNKQEGFKSKASTQRGKRKLSIKPSSEEDLSDKSSSKEYLSENESQNDRVKHNAKPGKMNEHRDSHKRSKKKKAKRQQHHNLQAQMINQQYPVQMPMMTMITPQFNMFGYPLGPIQPAQYMGYPNSFNYPGVSQFPMMFPQQNQYMNIMQQTQQALLGVNQNINLLNETSSKKITPEKQSKDQQMDVSQNIEVSTSRANNYYTFNKSNTQKASHDRDISANQILTQPSQEAGNLITSMNQEEFQKMRSQAELHKPERSDFSPIPKALEKSQVRSSRPQVDELNISSITKVTKITTQQNQQQAKNRLGSPSSNISTAKFDIQSTTVTADQSSSVAPSMINAHQSQFKQGLNPSDQIKQANQQYLNKIKEKFQKQSYTSGGRLIDHDVSQDNEQFNRNEQRINQQDKSGLLSPTDQSRNFIHLNANSSTPNSSMKLPNQYQVNESSSNQNGSYLIQPLQVKQVSSTRPSVVQQERDRRQLSIQPELRPLQMRQNEKLVQITYTSKQNESDIDNHQGKMDRHRSPQPLEIKMFTCAPQSTQVNGTSTRPFAQASINLMSQEGDTADRESNYYYNKKSSDFFAKSSQQDQSSSSLRQGDIQSKLKMLNARLQSQRQESNSSRQYPHRQYDQVSNLGENIEAFGDDDQSQFHMKYFERERDEVSQYSQRQTRIQNEASIKTDKSRSQTAKFSTQVNTATVQTRKIVIPIKNMSPRRKDSQESDSQEISTHRDLKSESKSALIIIDSSPKINSKQNRSKFANEVISSPKMGSEKQFPLKSELILGSDSMRSSIYALEDDMRAQRFPAPQNKTQKLIAKKRPSNTVKQQNATTTQQDFNGQLSHLEATSNFEDSLKQKDKSLIYRPNGASSMAQKGFHSSKQSVMNSGTKQQNSLLNSLAKSQERQFGLKNTLQSQDFSSLRKQITSQFQNQEDESTIFVQIYDNSQMKSNGRAREDQSVDKPLSELFKLKMGDKAIGQAPQKKAAQLISVSQVQDKNQVTDLKQDKERTKQDILELRKKMMKSTVKEKKDNFAVELPKDANGRPKDVPVELMQRLSKGQKVQVDQKEAIKLSHKNYENLPEIKRKKEEERKREDYKQRQQQVKKYAEEVDKKRKQLHIKKQTSNNEKQSDLI